MSNTVILFAVILIVFYPLCAGYATVENPKLVSTDWLYARLDDPNLRIVDARGGLRSYLQEHIPGAIFLSTETLRISREAIPGQLLPPDRLAEIFGQMGISSEHDVVVYSSAEDAFAAATYTALALVSIGHSRVAVLDGGIEKWKKEGRSLANDIPVFQTVDRGVRPDTTVFQTLDAIRSFIDSPGSVELLDARSPDQYKAGHIPTARNLFLRSLLRDEQGVSVWRSPDEIRDKLKEIGADPDRLLIAYCNSGREASQLWFTLRYVLGLDARVYDGSWIEWRARDLRTSHI